MEVLHILIRVSTQVQEDGTSDNHCSEINHRLEEVILTSMVR